MAENYDIPAPKKHMLSMQIDPALFEKATDEEKKQADVMAESTTFFKDGMRRLMRNPFGGLLYGSVGPCIGSHHCDTKSCAI